MVERAAVELCATEELNPYLASGTYTLEERHKGAKTVTSEPQKGAKEEQMTGHKLKRAALEVYSCTPHVA